MIETIGNATLKDNGKTFWYNGAESDGACSRPR